MIKPYFPAKSGPKPLCFSVDRRIRFEEVDPLGIVWHGRYASYFEDARVAHGDHFGIGYLDFHSAGVAAPIKKMHVDYILPLFYGDTCRIEARLHWSEAAKLNYEFTILNAHGDVTTRGYTIQLMLNMDRELLVALPDFYREFMNSWQHGTLGA
jgi:acyl-CoA thioester hydrolase